MPSAIRRRNRTLSQIAVLTGWLAVILGPPIALAEEEPHKADLAELAHKLNDPTSSIWALQAEFDWNIAKGDLSHGDNRHGGAMLFQPIMPIELTEKLKLLTRPVIPVVFGTSVPNPVVTSAGVPKLAWDTKSGLGDIAVSLLLTPELPSPFPKGLELGVGPTFSFPTATHNKLGSEKWEIGPAFVTVFKTKKVTAGFLAQHWFNVAGDDGRKDVNKGSIIYFAYYMFPGAWQVGMNPTISYDLEADPGNKLNLPIGLVVGKTLRIGKLPVKIQFGADYSVVRQDDLGQSWKVKLLITPVIPSLFKKPLFN